LVVDEIYRDLSSITADIDGEFLATGGIQRSLDVASDLPVIENAEVLRVGSPIARPGAVMCIGQNYAAHAAESGSEPPTVPIVFFKHPNTVVGPFDDVLIPPGATKLDWEVELGVVIGKRASYLQSADQAMDHIAGFVVSNDVSEREWQRERSGGQWSKGKTAATFNPVGPWLVPVDHARAVSAARIWSAVNGEPRQDSTTADMVFSVAHLIWDLSQYMVLDPGDLVNTGTPQGVAMSGRFPFLHAGDTVELGIDGLGVQRQSVAETPR
jgi:2-keto-4-pentenoate hydratase/2-oxohepta-3-ene-1,7-dioic acid hydratase in catechol pathway